MTDEVDPRTGELLTTNYGWTKPTVGASVDAWGGYINSDLDGIDSTVKSVSNAIPAASSTTPVMSGAGAVGVGTTWARADHQHPSDTSRYAASNPSGYQTAAQVTAALPVASSTTPLMDGTAAVGAGTTWARADHVHPTDTHALGDNRIINGDMRIDQRNNGSSGTATGYTVDRWQYGASLTGKGTWSRYTHGAPAILATGFTYNLGFTSSSAYAPLAGDAFYFHQIVEADMVGDFAWGTASAQPVTLSFWVYSSLTGTFSGAIRNFPLPATRSYPFTYSIPVANTWTKITVTIPGDTAGTWVTSGNAGAFALCFDFGGGTTFRGSAGAWANGNYVGATGAANVVATNGATFNLTGVKLEIGSVATPFPRQSLAKSLADCQRYYQQLGGTAASDVYIQAYHSAAGGSLGSTISFPIMRAAPTATRVGTWTQANVTSVSLFPGVSVLGLQVVVTAAGIAAINTTAGGTTYISLNAEL